MHANSLLDNFLFVGGARWTFEVDEKGAGLVARKLFKAVDDVRFSIGIQILFTKRRMIEGVKQLSQFSQMHADDCALTATAHDGEEGRGVLLASARLIILFSSRSQRT